MNKDSKKEQYKAKRLELIAMSQNIRLAVKEGIYDTVNEGLKEFYEGENPDIEEFNTFNQWKQKGFTIAKGSKAFLFWGQPRNYSQTPEGGTEPEEFKFFPLAYLFSNLQVINVKAEQAIKPKEKQNSDLVPDLVF
ncbi:MAG: hypothetical protein WCX31_04570 [Salinivirgaceae bacterium]